MVSMRSTNPIEGRRFVDDAMGNCSTVEFVTSSPTTVLSRSFNPGLRGSKFL